MRWLVTGSGGMLGTDMVLRLKNGGHQVTGMRRTELDITDPAALVSHMDSADVVVNCAAWTDVDGAETDEHRAFNLNALAPATLARAAAAAGTRLVHISTDYVFDGTANQPYGQGDLLGPVSAYGRTKAAGEWAVRAEADDHLIVRTAWLYGAAGPCFPRSIARAAQGGKELRVVGDQVGQPTWSADLADLIIRLVTANAPAGTYHGTSNGQVSWHGFAQAVVTHLGFDPGAVTEVTSQEFARPAPRPAYSVLSHDALQAAGVAPIGPWQERWQQAAAEVLAGL